MYNKFDAQVLSAESEEGSEIVQTVIVLGFALALGTALMAFKGPLGNTITSAGTQVTKLFGDMTGTPVAGA